METKGVPSHNWHIGEKVMAVFYEDRLMYRAKILQIKDWKDAAVVDFTEYGNEEEVNFSVPRYLTINAKVSGLMRLLQKHKKRPIKKSRKSRPRVKS